MRITGAACLPLVLLALFTAARAGDDGLAGNWKLSLIDDGQPVPLWLLKLESKGGKLTGALEGLRRMPAASLADARVDGDRLSFTINVKTREGSRSFAFEGLLPKAGGKKILGSMPWGEDDVLMPVQLESTIAKDPYEVEKELVTRFPNDPRVFSAVQELITKAADKKVPAKELQEWVDTALKSAEKYGPRFLQETAMRYAVMLVNKEGYAKVALEAARRAEKTLSAKDSALDHLAALDLLTTAMRKAGQDVPKEVDSRIAKLESAGHEEHHKKVLGFKVSKFAGRKAKSNHAVLVELFTGAQCPPCIAADVAFDALAKTYAPSEVVLLQYHEHIPLPDALTNADSEARMDYYKRAIRGTPTILIDGKPGPQVGGSLQHAEERYNALREEIDPLLEKPAAARVDVSAKRTGDKVHIKASVSEIEKPGDKLRLRLVLVEEWVRYRGRNSLSYHHHVVRAMPGGPQGTPLTKKDSQHTFDVDLTQLRKTLHAYLDDFHKNETPLLDEQRPMRLQNLRIVAFVQNDETREVLQAVEAPVRTE
jgi:hypothetical protein